jgi:hypothetical protein
VVRVTERKITMDEYGDKIRTHDLSGVTGFRVTTIKTTLDRPEPGAVTEEEAEERERRSELSALRERLDALNDDDDITNCSARFALEKQIHNLEQAGSPSEWPETIPG